MLFRSISENTRVEELRTRGGIIIKPFFDRNNNGKQDPGEENYWHPELITLDKQPLNPTRTNKLTDGVEIRAIPGSYRLDVNTTHLPPHWRSSISALRVNVALGTYTTVLVPLIPLYAIEGKVTDEKDRPISSIEVVATNISGAGERRTTISKADGSYELNDLALGTYEVSISGQSNPTIISIVSDSPIVQKLNLKLHYSLPASKLKLRSN